MLKPADLATQQQRAAADPKASVWVSASAGSGKTKVLTDRMLRLLLAGTLPQRLLCLTFTNAAAAEMANRLQQSLSGWATASEEDLIQTLTVLLGHIPSPDQIKRARCLFTDILDVPGGLKIMTIHAFCQSILRQFPMEARLSPHFQVIDEQSAYVLLKEAQHILLNQDLKQSPVLGLIQHPKEASSVGYKERSYQGTDKILHPFLIDSERECVQEQNGQQVNAEDVTQSLSIVTKMMDESRFFEVLTELIAQKSDLPKVNELPEYRVWLAALLDIDSQVHIDQLEAQILDEAPIKILMTLIESLFQGSAADQKKALVLQELRDGKASREDYIRLFLTAQGTPRQTFATKGVLKDFPHIREIIAQEAIRLEHLLQKIAAYRSFELSMAIVTLGAHVLHIYEGLKQGRNFLDYEDLIAYTAALLNQSDTAPWVLYKLDGGLDHILVDEAQDTNAQQWRVIAAIAEEFFAGQARSDLDRTVFVVGDEKQSIYSFQGADPAVFHVMRQAFQNAAENATQIWRDISLQISFRSTKAVLDVVDGIFSMPDMARGVSHYTSWPQHLPFRQGVAGRVELWPLITQEEEETPPTWEPPVKVEQRQQRASVQLAAQIAQQIQDWLNNQEYLPSRGRPIEAGDILILVQRRNHFVDALVGELKSRHIPLAGSDRLNLQNHLAIQDLLALARFVCLPQDDLNLAVILKGPLFQISEDELFHLSYQRCHTLWEEVQAQRPDLLERLNHIRELATHNTPFSFFHHILDIEEGRQKILAALGHESQDYLEEFLNVVSAFEKSNVPTLQHFLHWFEQADLDIKRKQEVQSNVVRIMTVHGAKGLQAPIVFLPDTTYMPPSPSGLVWYQHKPIWLASSVYRSAAIKQIVRELDDRQSQEYRRLLYVALTRAEDRLYVCGYTGRSVVSPQSWYSMIQRCLMEMGESEGEKLIYCCDQEAHVEILAKREEPQDVHELPLWAQNEPWKKRQIAPRSIPSLTHEAVVRGTLIHKLLQHLPQFPQEHHLSVGLRILENEKRDDKLELIRIVQELVNHPSLKFIFTENALAEVPIKLWKESQIFTGQIDRLIFQDDKILIVDFKTSQEKHMNLLPSYKSQLSAYRTAVQQLYPHTRIETAILWVDAQKLEYV